MSVTSEHRRASRLSDTVGTLLILVGGLGFVAAVGLTAWSLHDLDKVSAQFPVGAFSKIQAVAIVGLTPGMLSLLVIAFGVYLQTRSTELLFGTAIDPFADDDFEDDDGEDDELPIVS
jgi:hypothetical protein